MTARCHAFSCDDPTGGPEPTADLDGMPAHEDCAEYELRRRADREPCIPHEVWGSCGVCLLERTITEARASLSGVRRRSYP